jgi:hypothetical protein
MIGIQKEKFVQRKMFLMPTTGFRHYKGQLKVPIHTPLTHVPADVLAQSQAGATAMSTPQEKVASVWRLADLKSVTAIQSRLRIQYGRETPTRKRIRVWNKNLRTAWNLFV